MNPKVSEIKELINKRQYLNAQKKATDLLKILTEEKDIINCCLTLAEAYSKDIKNLKAIEELNKVLVVFPYNPQILEALYDLFFKLKRFNEAEQVLKDLLMSEPENISYIIRLVKSHISQENYIEALKELSILIAQGNYSPTINGLTAFCFEKLNLYSEQLKQIKIMQEMNPNNYEMYFKEAEILINMGDYEEGISNLNTCFDTYQEINGIDKNWIEKVINFTDFFCNFGLKANLIEKLSFIDYKKLDLKLKTSLLNTLKNHKMDIYFTGENIKNYTDSEIIEHSNYYSDYFKQDNKSLAKKYDISKFDNYIKFLINLH